MDTGWKMTLAQNISGWEVGAQFGVSRALIFCSGSGRQPGSTIGSRVAMFDVLDQTLGLSLKSQQLGFGHCSCKTFDALLGGVPQIEGTGPKFRSESGPGPMAGLWRGVPGRNGRRSDDDFLDRLANWALKLAVDAAGCGLTLVQPHVHAATTKGATR
jgi:hypothetical protein